ncbi:hypothetical protein OG937_01855 [Streptomyces sp. NBC_00510]
MKWRGLSSADGGPTVVAGIAQCENFLSWHAAISDAKAAAETFADRMPWLTTAQRREVLRLYVADRLDQTCAAVTLISERERELSSEYNRRYSALRRRLLRRVVAVALVAAAVCVPVPLLLIFAGH